MSCPSSETNVFKSPKSDLLFTTKFTFDEDCKIERGGGERERQRQREREIQR